MVPCDSTWSACCTHKYIGRLGHSSLSVSELELLASCLVNLAQLGQSAHRPSRPNPEPTSRKTKFDIAYDSSDVPSEGVSVTVRKALDRLFQKHGLAVLTSSRWHSHLQACHSFGGRSSPRKTFAQQYADLCCLLEDLHGRVVDLQ